MFVLDTVRESYIVTFKKVSQKYKGYFLIKIHLSKATYIIQKQGNLSRNSKIARVESNLSFLASEICESSDLI